MENTKADMPETSDVTLQSSGKYRIKQVIGKGAMGVVYRGFDPNIERVVAIKRIQKSKFQDQDWHSIAQRFRREAQAAGRLHHPNIVTVHDYGEEDGDPYIVMEFVEGVNLGGYLQQKRSLSVDETLSIMGKLLNALAYSHSKGVIHRDIKPGNVFIMDNGEVKLSDFGIAKLEQSDLTQPGLVLGTPSYMSPEQIKGKEIDVRSDLFSAGVVFYEMLTGKRPFEGDQIYAVMNNVLTLSPTDPCQLNPEIPSNLKSVIRKALEKNPDNRFQTADEFARALKDCGRDADTVALPAPSLSARRRMLMAVLACLAVAAIAGAGVWMGRQFVRPSPLKSQPSGPGSGIVSGGVPMPSGAHPRQVEPVKKAASVPAAAPPGPASVARPGGPPSAKTSSPTPARPAPGAPTEPRVSILTTPAGASVYINGKSYGITPVTIALRPDHYRLVLRKEGYQEIRDDLVIEPNSGTFEYNVGLERMRGFD
jgi:eukaryotic-like serine/threonine-protein kinase